jgi:YesN/AraC family two-component response regulator
LTFSDIYAKIATGKAMGLFRRDSDGIALFFYSYEREAAKMRQMRLQILVADSGGRGEQYLSRLRSVVQDSEYIIAKHTSDLNEAVDDLLVHHSSDILICINRSPNYIAAKLLRLIGGSSGQIPAIVISENDDSQRMRECFLLGAIDFLSEPVPPEDLLNALSRAATMIHKRMIETEYRSALEETLSHLIQTPHTAPIIAKLEEFLLEIREQTATVELAADYFGFNRDYFGRYFKSKFGMTFGDFYKDFQMRYAQLLLGTGQFKVQDVSKLLGFSTPDYFTRVFRKRTGRVPSEIKSGDAGYTHGSI